jgi:formylglycine-generating enzyme required for sulfatase activity
MATDVEALWRNTLGHALEGADAGATCRPFDEEAGPLGTMDTLFPNESGEPATSPFAHGAYVVGGELGRGGMAVVHRARQTRLGRDIALKIAHDASGAAARRRFVAEAQVTGILEHPNVVAVHELAETRDGRLALAMKLVEGRPWSRAIAAGDLSLAEHVGILADVCNAVAFAHERGFAHCDLKPDNVMLGAFGEVVVMDWGCAVGIGPAGSAVARRASEIHHPFGTPAYMAPELAHGDGSRIGAATDVYLLGAILYELLSGHPPHTREAFVETLFAAATGVVPPLGADAPAALAAICERAMAPLPADRQPSVVALRDELRAWLERRRSLELSDRAAERLAACAARVGPGAERNALYIEIAAAMAGFEQARLLWADNPEALSGERSARRLVVDTALGNGDLGLAAAHAERMSPDEGRDEVLARIEASRAANAAARTTARRMRMGLVVSLAALLATAAVGLVAVNAERARAEEDLAEIQRLSDVQVLRQLESASSDLWPALPARVPELRDWLTREQVLADRLPAHRARLALPWDERDPVAQWEHDTLAGLVTGLDQLAGSGAADIRARLALAETLAVRSLDDAKPDWDAAITRIAASPAYHGLALAPQLGLVPLGPDPASGLEEFAHLASGEAAHRGTDGRIAPFAGMGVVLVLVPPGTFTMGTATGKPLEGPPNPVTLDAFFFGTYEFTQDQWVRATGGNPSAYQPGRVIGDKVYDALHPVELVGWRDAHDVLARLALALPTEAQWEYAARGGTTTEYWTGDNYLSLQGAANIADHWGQSHGGPDSWVWEPALDDGWLAHAPIGSFRPNPFGLHDTAGNVWEWCLDKMGAYSAPVRPGDGAREAPADAPQLFRGGGFRANRAHARSADRYPLTSTDFTSFDIGLRAARPVDPG